MQAIQLVALYTIYIDMINDNRMTLDEAVSNLAAAGLTTTDFDTWYGEDGREFHFPLQLPFPKQSLTQGDVLYTETRSDQRGLRDIEFTISNQTALKFQ